MIAIQGFLPRGSATVPWRLGQVRPPTALYYWQDRGVIINALNGYYVLATDAAQVGEPPRTQGLGLDPRNDCIIATTIHAVDDERVLLTASYRDEEPTSLLDSLVSGWPYVARVEITASDVLQVVTAKGTAMELTPGPGRFGLAVHARMAPDDWSARDPREHHLLTVWPIHPTKFWSRFELPRPRPTESGPPSMSIPALVQMFRDGVTPLVRTDFSDDAQWSQVVLALTSPAASEDQDDELDGYIPNITPVDSSAFEGLNAAALAEAYDDESVGFVLLADAASMQPSDDPTIVYVDMYDDPGRSFRCIVNEVASVEANLAIANMDFIDFSDNVASDGVFRGFPAG